MQQDSLITPDEYKALFHDGVLRFTFGGCAVCPQGVFAFLTQPYYTEKQYNKAVKSGYDFQKRPKGIVALDRGDAGGARWSGVQYLNGWSPVVICPSCEEPGAVVGMETRPRSFDDTGNRIFTFKDGEITELEPLYTCFGTHGGFVRGALQRVRSIAGALYVCGLGRTVARSRSGLQWESYNALLPDPISSLAPDASNSDRLNATLASMRLGFQDICGFSEDDLYAAGGRGDLWHFNGQSWKQRAFPNNVPVFSLCCGLDGLVYVCAGEGRVFAGREDSWNCLTGTHSGLNMSMAWFGGQLWLSSERGLWTVREGQVERADVPDWVRYCAGSLATDGGTLLLAGAGGFLGDKVIDGGGGAAYLENGEWRKILLFDEMEKATAR